MEFDFSRYSKIVANDLSLNGSISSALGGLSQWSSSGNDIYFNNGNVGIGTSSPSQKLDVRGNMRLGDGSSIEQDINFVSDVGDWQVGTNIAGNGTDSNQFYIWESAYRLTIQKGTGNVGIGTTSPSSKLDVNGSIRAGYDTNTTSYFGRVAIGHGTNISNDFAVFSHIDHNSTSSFAVGQNNSGGTIINSKSSAQGIRFRIDNVEKMRLGDSGSLQVGYDTDTMSYFGRAAIGSKTSYGDQAYFGHLDQINTGTYGNYAILQDGNGSTYINAATNQHIWFRNNNNNYIGFITGSNAYIGLYNTGSETKVHFRVNEYSGTTAEVNFRNSSGDNGCRIKAMQYLNISDDRMKINEKLLTNATETLMKLTPQLYDEYLSEEIKEETRPSVGLIAQEVYYNAPELRDYIVGLPVDNSGNECTPEEIDLSNQDMENDPDYEALGWTKDHYASLNYSSLIPYLIKSNQEQQEEINAEKAKITTLETQLADVLSRLSALENN